MRESVFYVAKVWQNAPNKLHLLLNKLASLAIL
mgnify:CR=1 FL=1